MGLGKSIFHDWQRDGHISSNPLVFMSVARSIIHTLIRHGFCQRPGLRGKHSPSLGAPVQVLYLSMIFLRGGPRRACTSGRSRSPRRGPSPPRSDRAAPAGSPSPSSSSATRWTSPTPKAPGGAAATWSTPPASGSKGRACSLPAKKSPSPTPFPPAEPFSL